MIIDTIKHELATPSYYFLKTNKHLGANIILLTLGGSYAYGTNVETSDIDIRGCTLQSKSDILGLSDFDQVEDNVTDTVIYGFNKLIGLISNCNPNTIEMLGCKPEHYLYISNIGQELLDNKHMFLSKKAIYSFGGYANQQLRRLSNAIMIDNSQEEQEKHIMMSVLSAMMTFGERYSKFDEGSIRLSIGKSRNPESTTEIFADINLQHYPLRDYKNIWSDINNIVKCYRELNHRNKKKDDVHVNKHTMHLIRLYLMAFDILENEKIITYREHDIPLLMKIRNGEFRSEDGSFNSEFYEMLNEMENRFLYAKNNTSLPDSPNYKHIEDFVMSVNERVVRDEF